MATSAQAAVKQRGEMARDQYGWWVRTSKEKRLQRSKRDA